MRNSAWRRVLFRWAGILLLLAAAIEIVFWVLPMRGHLAEKSPDRIVILTADLVAGLLFLAVSRR